MNIIINNSSMQPIYEQIVGQMKEQIMNGTLKQDAALPSVRTLSKDLRISALTVKKAYDVLEQEGFVITVHGKGSFVAGANAEMIREEHLRQMEEHLRKAVELSRGCAIPLEEMTDLLSMLYKEEDR